MSDLTKRETPEERELDAKRRELAAFECQLADAELEYHTLLAELGAFEVQYFLIVGKRLARLDELQAQLAEALAELQPESAPLAEKAEEARKQAQSSAGAFEEFVAASPDKPRPLPTEDCRKVYIEAAKAMHPDLAVAPEEKTRRHKFMAALNEAYEAGDLQGIQRILNDWNSSPESVPGDGVGAELIRVIRKIAQVQTRLQEISAAKETLTQSDRYKLWQEAMDIDLDATKYLDGMAAALDNEIGVLEQELKLLRPSNKEAKQPDD